MSCPSLHLDVAMVVSGSHSRTLRSCLETLGGPFLHSLAPSPWLKPGGARDSFSNNNDFGGRALEETC